MFILKKEVRDVLRIFSSLANSLISDENVVIILVRDKVLTLMQENLDCLLLYQIPIESDETYVVYWNIKDFSTIIDKLNCDVRMDSTGIYTNTGRYTFNSITVNRTLEEVLELRDSLLQNPIKKVMFKDIKKLKIAKNFVGKEVTSNQKDYTCVILDKDKVLATDGNLTYRDNMVESESVEQLSNNFFINDSVIKAIPDSFNFDICVYEHNDFWSMCGENGLQIFINFKYNQEFFDLDAPEGRAHYEHNDSFIFNYGDFFKKLEILMIKACNNPNNKLYLLFKDKKMYIENREDSKSFDIVDCKYPEHFENEYIIVDGKYLMQLGSLLKGQVKVLIDLNKPVLNFIDISNPENNNDKRLLLYARLKDLQKRN